MTKKQELAIKTLKEAFFNTFSYGAPEKYEMKSVDIDDLDGVIYVRLEIGLIGDEGTMAEIFCRNHTRVFVGPRGGYYNYREKSNKRCTLNTLQAVYFDYHRDQLAKKRSKKV